MGATHPDVCFTRDDLLSAPCVVNLADECFRVTPRKGEFFHETIYEVPFPLELDDSGDPVP
jgi:hypothetical protein